MNPKIKQIDNNILTNLFNKIDFIKYHVKYNFKNPIIFWFFEKTNVNFILNVGFFVFILFFVSVLLHNRWES